MTLLWLKKQINTERKILFILFLRQLSSVVTLILGILCLILTGLISFGTIIFVIVQQSNQIQALKETFHQLCTQALIDHLDDQNENTGENSQSD